MKTKKVYEYLVTKEWFGALEKGSRLYYDSSVGGYIFHTEFESQSKSDKYECFESNSTDYFMSVSTAEKYINRGDLIPGPELGELEFEE